MSKNKGKKRVLKRKVKRTIRYTVAALFMVTAIIVAAIPAQTNRADDGSISTQADATDDRDTDYSYPVEDDRTVGSGTEPDSSSTGGSYYTTVPVGNSINLSLYHQNPQMSGVYEGYNVIKLSNGYYLNWQYKYYLQGDTNSSSATGVLCDYNDDFAVQEQTLSLRLPTGYVTVDPDKVNTYFTSGEGNNQQSFAYAVTFDESSREYKKFQKYNGTLFNEWLKTCEQYRSDLERYNELKKQYDDAIAGGQTGLTEPTAPTVPADCVFTPSGLSLDMRRQYYCDYVLEYENQTGLADRGSFTLTPVQDATKGSIVDSYLIQVLDTDGLDSTLTTKLDTNNFLCSGVSDRLITAIGDYAFYNVRNIETMNMPSEIAYVGDYAFYNSFIKHVNLSNVKTLGNAAFKSTQLESVNLGTGLTIIGSEAFANNTKLTSVEFPVTITDIRDGAFASCLSLGNVDLSTINSNFTIGKWCFYDCQSLSGITFPDGVTNKNLQSVGEGALAIAKGSTSDVALSVEFPSNLTDLPDLLFAGRSNLQNVVFPASYGSTSAISVPKNMFLGCANLASVKFPDSCLYVTYGSDNFEFYDVQNPDFYVEGPALMRNQRDYAEPRKATWYEKTYVNDFVPYRFTLNGVQYYETGSKDGDYILTVDESGKMTSCIQAPGNTSTSIDLVIPSKVGAYDVVSVEEGCFDTVKDKLKTVTVSDDSISTIDDRTFEGCPLLEEVTIGDSVSTVGDSAFANCPKLKNVTFHTPTAGYNNFTIGTNAFETKSTELTFHADIVDGYAPFDWAMEPDNYVDSQTGVRVCYQSQSPTYLKVMYDKNQDGEVTLIDYPKYDKLDEDHADHNTEMEQYYYKIYGDSDYDTYRQRFAQKCIDAFNADSTLTAIPEELYEDDTYGPWINTTLNSTVAVDDGTGTGNTVTKTNWQVILDELGYTGTNSIPVPDAYYSSGRNSYSILKNAEGNSDKIWESLTPEEADWVYSCLNIDVPEAVTSLDVNTFINGTSDGAKNFNSNNVQTYINTRNNSDAYKMYQQSTTVDGAEVVGGLFSGYYKDGKDGTEKTEADVKGNDYVQSITLRGIKSLPDYCFDNCESLTTVNLGDACTDVGKAPFRGCPNISSVGANSDYYVYDNGILYETLDNGYYKIKECMASRGTQVGQPVINSTNDPLITKISEIEKGAFSECNDVAYVDFSDASSLQEIPEDAFYDCENLSTVILPESVNSIKDNAFAGNDRVSVTIPGKEVFIATSAFEHKPTVVIRTYKDTSAYEYGTYYGQTVELISDSYRVIFLDHDGTQLGEVQYIEEGKNAVPPEDPTWEGHTFTGWSGEYIGITKDTVLVAQYYTNGSTDDPNNNGGNNNGNNGNNNGNNGNSGSDSSDESSKYTLTVVNGSGGGTYAAGTSVIITANNPPTGKVFYNWTMSTTMNIVSSRSAATTITMPASNATVTANYIDSGSSYLTVSSNEVQPLKNNSVSGNNGNNSTNTGTTTNTTNRDNNSGTKVSITKPGISNRDLASATVNGSTDNFIVKISDSALATEEVQQALLARYGSLDAIRYVAMDISLYDSTGTTKITDTTGLTVDVTLPLPDDLIQYAGNNKTAAVANGQLEDLTPKFTTIDGVACVTFRATHFSPYTIYADTNNLVSGLDQTPKTGDGIAPKWFLSIGFAAVSILLFMKKDKPAKRRKLA